MARGKKSAQHARNIAESAAQVVSELHQEKLASTSRARAAEKKAAKIPELEREVRRLKKQLAEGTSDQLEAARQELAEIHRQHHEDLMELYRLLDGRTTFTDVEFGTLRRLLGPDGMVEVFERHGGTVSRTLRRELERGGKKVTSALRATRQAQR